MIKKLTRSKHSSLKHELVFFVIVSLGIAALFFSAINHASQSLLYSYFLNSDYIATKTNEAAENFQSYITQYHLTSNDKDSIYHWAQQHRILNLTITKGEDTIFDMFSSEDTQYSTSSYEYTNMPFVYDLTFSDSDTTLYLVGSFDYNAYTICNVSCLILTALLFLVLFTRLIYQKVAYIHQLQYEVQQLENGNLDYPITIQGKDELAFLAKSLDHMRFTVKLQMESERKALISNRQLITALSHDLRTPLTTQLGYLEILKEQHYSSREEEQKYLQKCIHNCQEIKQMSDRLFDYFFAYSKTDSTSKLTLEKLNGIEFFLQLIYETKILLEEKGYHFQIHCTNQSCFILANIDGMIRIFHNIFSNLVKYADSDYLIQFDLTATNTDLVLTVINQTKQNIQHSESTGIGLDTVKRFVTLQNGTMECNQKEREFQLILKFPFL